MRRNGPLERSASSSRSRHFTCLLSFLRFRRPTSGETRSSAGLGWITESGKILLAPVSHPKRILPKYWLWFRVLAAPEGFRADTSTPTARRTPPWWRRTSSALATLSTSVRLRHRGHAASARRPRRGRGPSNTRPRADLPVVRGSHRTRLNAAKRAMCALTTLYLCVTLHALK